jgi:hypothetical protein
MSLGAMAYSRFSVRQLRHLALLSSALSTPSCIKGQHYIFGDRDFVRVGQLVWKLQSIQDF